jgi:hypothetical protein
MGIRAARARTTAVFRFGQWPIIIAAWFGLTALLLAPPARVLADCAVGDPACVEADRTSGVPGTQVTLSPFGPGCEPGPGNWLQFAAGTYDETRSYPRAALRVRYQGETREATFIVPEVAPGPYALALTCDTDMAVAEGNPGALLGFTFTVLAPPDTATGPGDLSPIGIALLVLAAGVGVGAALRRTARRTGQR